MGIQLTLFTSVYRPNKMFQFAILCIINKSQRYTEFNCDHMPNKAFLNIRNHEKRFLGSE